MWDSSPRTTGNLGIADSLPSFRCLGTSLENESATWLYDRSRKKISRDRKALDTFLTYIHSHYTGKISLKDLADAVSVSPGECERLCKRLLHQTPMNYLMTYRIEQSIPLLVNTSYTITEIALQVGFSGASYYTEIFHRIMGITPSDYRCRIRGALPG